MSDNNDNKVTVRHSPWRYICETITWVAFFAFCFAFCARNEIVEIMK